MKMLARIQIQSQMGTLAIRSQSARLEGGPAKRHINIRGNSQARIQMQSTPAEIRIDQTASRDSAGIVPIMESNRRAAAKGVRHFDQRIGGIAQEGLAVMKIERDGGGGWAAMRRIAANKGYKNVRLTAAWVNPPDISATKGSLEINDASQKVQSGSYETPSTSRYTPGSVTITWGTEPSITITVIPGAELSFPSAQGTGMNLDAAI
jgi:hypothetical protein